jgi:hypothetical protein
MSIAFAFGIAVQANQRVPQVKVRSAGRNHNPDCEACQ